MGHRHEDIECGHCGSEDFDIINEQAGVAICRDCGKYFDFEVEDDSYGKRNKWDDDEEW